VFLFLICANRFLAPQLDHRSLKQTAANVKDTGKKLDIVVDFLSDMQSQLSAIDGKLNKLLDDVNTLLEGLLTQSF